MRVLLKVVAAAGLVVVAVAAIAFALFASQFGDRSPALVIGRNERAQAAVLFLCDAPRSLADCRGRPIPARTAVSNYLRDVSGENGFAGDIIVTDDTCHVMFMTEYSANDHVAVVILANQVEVRTDISEWAELNKPGFEELPWALPDVVCPLDEGAP
jgi:hypothetical protein